MSASLAQLTSSGISSSNNKENNTSLGGAVSNKLSRTKRRSTLTAKEFQELRVEAELNSIDQQQKQQTMKQQQKQRRRSSSMLKGIDPANIIIGDSSDRQWSAVAGGQTPSPSSSPAESEAQRADALTAEIDRIFNKSVAPSLRRSLRRKSFSISLSTSAATKTSSSTSGSALTITKTSTENTEEAADVIDPALVQLYRQVGTYKPPQPKGLGTIPELSTGNRGLPTSTKRRFIDFDSPARLGMKDRTRCRKAQKMLNSSANNKQQRKGFAAASTTEQSQQMDMEQFKAYVDGLNLHGDC